MSNHPFVYMWCADHGVVYYSVPGSTPSVEEGTNRPLVKTDWFSPEGYVLHDYPVYMEQLETAPLGESYWDLAGDCMRFRYPRSPTCGVGQCGSFPECIECGTTHIRFNMDPPCVDHG